MKQLLLLIVMVVSSSAFTNSFAQSDVKSELIKVKTADGITLNGALWTPVSRKPRVGIILTHGTGGSGG